MLLNPLIFVLNRWPTWLLSVSLFIRQTATSALWNYAIATFSLLTHLIATIMLILLAATWEPLNLLIVIQCWSTRCPLSHYWPECQYRSVESPDCNLCDTNPCDCPVDILMKRNANSVLLKQLIVVLKWWLTRISLSRCEVMCLSLLHCWLISLRLWRC